MSDEPIRAMGLDDGVPEGLAEPAVAQAADETPPVYHYGQVNWVRYRQISDSLGLDYGRLRIYLDGADVTMDVAGGGVFDPMPGDGRPGYAYINVVHATHTDVVRRVGQVEIRALPPGVYL